MSDSAKLDLDRFLAMPRLAGLAISPDGARLVVGAATPDEGGTRFTSALWSVDPAGQAPARRLTRSPKGETAPVFAPDGTLLFTSARPTSADDEDEAARLWALPAEGGDPIVVADPPSGIAGVVVARDTGTVVVGASVHPGAQDWEADREQAKARKERKVSAQLIEQFPMRFWDRWIGPRQRGLYATASLPDEGSPGWTAITPDPGHDLEEQSFDVSADGTTVVLGWLRTVADPRERSSDLVAIDLSDDAASHGRRTLVSEPRVSFAAPAISPDGTQVAALRVPLGTPSQVPDTTLVVVDLAGGAGSPRDALPGFDLWPHAPLWLPDGSGLVFTADSDGRTLPFRLDLGSGDVTRLAAEGAYSDLVCAPDGSAIYAVHADVALPPRVVALDPGVEDQDPRVLHGPIDVVLPGRVERVETTAEDGARVPGWLVLPTDADGPVPLVVFIHGGPLASWAGWHWRWNPHLLAAQGYAVLCPDPALSTGYGLDHIARGWGRWGAEPYTDILALTDEVEARPDIDASRTAAMGGSFGGYMANWIAGHTDRFDAIVTHASLWNLEAFHGTTDLGPWWENEFGDRYTEPDRFREWSPHRFVDRITTPMLVIHGERDFRVPVSEGLSLWTDLQRHGVTATYLHFPDENHWILSPQHARLWYATVLAFLDHHVLGKPWERPELL
jgi:dipeptidyl aminopeptidase/acylaminoacyl peptidase